MLQIQKYIKKHGIEKTINDFSLHTKFYDHKVILKYDQLNSNFNKQEVRESRGLILELGTWNVMCLPFFKFFSYDDSKAHKIHWNIARVLTKRDGSLITLYYDYVINEWCFSTMGSANAEGKIITNEELSDTTFGNLAFEYLKTSNVDLNKLKTKYNYVFEITSQFNKVVTDYNTTSLKVLTIRDVNTLKELKHNDVISHSKKHKLEVVKQHDYESLQELLDTFKNKDYRFEGYVVVDSEFNRIKVKNPAWRVTHLMKTRDGLKFNKTPHYLIDIIRSNNIEHFIKEFPNTKEIVERLYDNFVTLQNTLEIIKAEIVFPKNISKQESSRFASDIFSKLKHHGVNSNFSSFFFMLKQNKSLLIDDYLYDMKREKLYNNLK